MDTPECAASDFDADLAQWPVYSTDILAFTNSDRSHMENVWLHKIKRFFSRLISNSVTSVNIFYSDQAFLKLIFD